LHLLKSNRDKEPSFIIPEFEFELGVVTASISSPSPVVGVLLIDTNYGISG